MIAVRVVLDSLTKSADVLGVCPAGSSAYNRGKFQGKQLTKSLIGLVDSSKICCRIYTKITIVIFLRVYLHHNEGASPAGVYRSAYVVVEVEDWR